MAHDEDQLQRAETSRDRIEAVLRRPVVTRIEPLDGFYLAEGYHQKYRLKSDRLLYAEMQAHYPREQDITNSTVAARLNGFAGGSGRCALLDSEIADYGLSPNAGTYLRTLCRG